MTRTGSVSQCGAARRASLVVRAQADPRRTAESSDSLANRAAACTLAAAVLFTSNLSPALAKATSSSQGDLYEEFLAKAKAPGSKVKILEAKKAPTVAPEAKPSKAVKKVAAPKPSAPKPSAPKKLAAKATKKAPAASSGDVVLKVAATDVRKGVQGSAPGSVALPVPKAQLRLEAAAAKAEAEKKAAALKAEAAKPKSEAQKKAAAAAAALAAAAAAEQAAEVQRAADAAAAAAAAKQALTTASNGAYEAGAVVALEVVLASAAASFVSSFSGKAKAKKTARA